MLKKLHSWIRTFRERIEVTDGVVNRRLPVVTLNNYVDIASEVSGLRDRVDTLERVVNDQAATIEVNKVFLSEFIAELKKKR